MGNSTCTRAFVAGIHNVEIWNICMKIYDTKKIFLLTKLQHFDILNIAVFSLSFLIRILC